MVPTPTRRHLLSGLTLAALPQLARATPGMPRAGTAAPPEGLAAWGQFRQALLRPEGRVVDTGNQGISHSEGQGWAMFCAERCDDRASFDRLWDWTRRTLARPNDRLLAWRFQPGAPQPVADRNNATDGDIFAAAALLLAAQRWAEPRYAEAGGAMAQDVLRLLVRQVAGRVLLLPGLHGFEEAESIIVNPSYYAFPLLGVLARAVPDPLWLRLAADGLELLRQARFGRWNLAPDWLQIDRRSGALRLPGRWPPRFSYDALRVPFYLCWAGLAEEPVCRAAARFWTDPAHRHVPVWADLTSDAVSPYPAPPGLQAVTRFVAVRTGQGSGGGPLLKAERPYQYYPEILRVMVLLAAADSPSG